MKPHILLLPANRLQKKGAPPPRFGIAEAFERLGFSAEVMDVNDVPRNPIARRPSLFASIDPWRALKILFARRHAYALVSYYQSGALLILALRRLVRFKPLVVIVDVGDDSNWPLRARLVSYCVKRADAVFSFARDQADHLVARYPGALVKVLPQQIDTHFFTPGEGDAGYILAVGNDVSRDYATLEKAVRGLDVRVKLRTDKVTPWQQATSIPRGTDEDLRDLYRRAAIVVVPLFDMLHPGGISTLLEAFACGKAVVACAARGIRDYLQHEENCLVVPCGDSEAMGTAIVRLLQDEALRQRLGSAARAFAERELSQDRYAERLAAALATLRRV